MTLRDPRVAMMLAIVATIADAPLADDYRVLKGTPPNPQRMTKAQRKAEKRARSHTERRKRKP